MLADVVAGRDVLATSSKGCDLAFVAPIANRLGPRGQPSVLILVPTRELAARTFGVFQRAVGSEGLRVATISGGAGIARQIKAARRADVLIAVPGRVLELLRRRLLRLNGVAVCILDRADRMLDMGFLPSLTVVLSVLPEQRQTMIFSRTFDGEIGLLASRFTINPVRHQLGQQERPASPE
jgi:ATP-dependent RNA helicase DeaD